MAMTIVVDADRTDAVHTTTDQKRGSDAMQRSIPMRIAATTGSANGVRVQRPAGGWAASGQWWKAWALLTSLGATVLGWMALSMGEPSVESVVVGPAPTPRLTQIAPARQVSGLEQPRPLPPSVGVLPAMPQKPVFQAPVTRTRRS
jgi:hypothetical protein